MSVKITMHPRSGYNIKVEPITVARLIDINRQFYQTFGLQFSATRQRLQPGVQIILGDIMPEARLLDLGCGNGELALALVRRGFKGMYIGLDFSPLLLEQAHQAFTKLTAAPELLRSIAFSQADLTTPDWHRSLSTAAFDQILALAVLHHVPGKQLRCQILEKTRALLMPGGKLVLSVWQFLNSPRLVKRIQDWGRASIDPCEVEAGDYLLDWRHGGSGLRYVHHFSAQELADLAEDTRFDIHETFYSDGEGGRLGLYQVWMPV